MSEEFRVVSLRDSSGEVTGYCVGRFEPMKLMPDKMGLVALMGQEFKFHTMGHRSGKPFATEAEALEAMELAGEAELIAPKIPAPPPSPKDNELRKKISKEFKASHYVKGEAL